MKRSTKAALLSGLVFPGLGHLYLKFVLPGCMIIVIAASALFFILSTAVDTALEVVDRINAGEVALDMAAISNAVAEQASANAQSTEIATYLLIACWLIGLVDSIRRGRHQESVASGVGNEEHEVSST